MILIADSGSTKCDWILADINGEQLLSSQTEGINPMALSDKAITSIIRNNKDLQPYKTLVTQIHFYGAGCGTRSADKKMKLILEEIFENNVHIGIKEDVVAAIHATTTKPGVICILGTGSNCCYFDGTNIIQKIPSLGYVLSDEGSGNYIGKALLRAHYHHKMPANIKAAFEDDHDTDMNQMFQHLYHNQNPNKYLASFARFAFQHRNDPFIENILHKTIASFIETYLTHYHNELQRHPIHFVGSIAYYSQDILTKQLKEKGYRASTFVRKPIDNLIKYIAGQKIHTKN
ncbi:BadF/BadG/BcrA/BcrD ATPase family protein [Galbibacter pacificus]|uniref:N-acetylglucosamine kinase n=1 Tax=Galbibacter pacificus TaxID=2996052 RepID=A0ABT6FUY0_9FLAO|nr:BadF/BadG/BcrA/BcrD ATPase family protein [Galbibacter pacificus]MDG3583455.1 BadF/BadG/BcrA/BcrD ATPase family protein [Galbibacter pacificus]MDG3587068.1 N-acetylglucosamine kinase [Galbibacter pacificus]